MKVFEIFEANEFSVVPQGTGTDRVFNIVSPDGNVVGSERIAGAARSRAAELSANLDTPSTATSSTRSAPTPDTDTFKLRNVQLLGEDGRIKCDVVMADGTVKPFEGLPKDLGPQILDDLPQAKKGWFRRRVGKVKDWVVRKTSWIISNTFFGVLGGTISAFQVLSLWQDYQENTAMLRILMEEEHLDNAASRAILVKSFNFIQASFWTAACTEVIGVFVSTITASKLLRMARVARSGALAIPGAGWLVALLTTAAIEGSLFLATWAINKYGPRWLAENFLDEWTIGEGPSSELEPIDIDDPELQRAMQRDAESDETPTDQSSIQNISRAIQQAGNTQVSGPSGTPSAPRSSGSGSSSSSGGSSNFDSDAIARLRALANN